MIILTPWPHCMTGLPSDFGRMLTLGDVSEHPKTWIDGIDYIRRIQTEEFWTVNVAAKGLAALRIPRKRFVRFLDRMPDTISGEEVEYCRYCSP